MKQQSKNTLIVIVALIVGFIIVSRLGIGQYFTLERVREYSAIFKQYVDKYYILSVFVYINVVAALVAAALPVITPASLLAGFLYGALFGGIYAIIAATLGSILTFLFVRYVIREPIYQRYGAKLTTFNAQMNKYGAAYLMMLELSTVVPFFVINTLAGLSPISLFTFTWAAALGTSPFILINAFAGRKLGELQSFGDILQPPMIMLLILLSLLALAPIVIKRLTRSFDW